MTLLSRSSNSAPELAAGHHAAQVKRQDAAALQRLRHVAGSDALRKPLGDGRLAHASLADDRGVVLGPACESLHDAPDLRVAADDGVQLFRRALAASGQR